MVNSSSHGPRLRRCVDLARRLLAVAGLCALVLPGLAQAQAYPDKSKPVRIIVPTGPASAVDLLARSMAKAMADEGGWNAVVENKPGAELAIGVQALIASPPDGYTLMVTSSSSQSLNPVLIPGLKYDPVKDYMPVATLSKAGLTMNLGPSSGTMSAREFIEDARANPGKRTCATGSTTQRMACEMLQAAAGIKLLIVPYKTTAAAMTALAGGEVDTIFVDGGTAMAQWQSGRVRGAAATSAERIGVLPKLPTLREEGLADFNMTAWYAVYAPDKMPPAVLATVREAVRKAARTKTFTDTLAQFAMDPLDLTPEQVNDMTRREVQGWGDMVRRQNIKIAN